jgi:hypothetical protein
MLLIFDRTSILRARSRAAATKPHRCATLTTLISLCNPFAPLFSHTGSLNKQSISRIRPSRIALILRILMNASSIDYSFVWGKLPMALPSIRIGDDLLDDALLASVEITQELNQHWRCAIDCRQTEDKRIPIESFLGKSVDIKTYDDQGIEYTHFSGIINDVGLNFEVHGSYTAQILAVSSSYKMDVSHWYAYYQEKTLSSVGSAIADRCKLSVTVKAADNKPLNYTQYGESDFSFLNRIVDDYSAWLRPNEDGVEIFDSFQREHSPGARRGRPHGLPHQGRHGAAQLQRLALRSPRDGVNHLRGREQPTPVL